MKHRKSGNMKNANYIDKNGFFVGNDHRNLTKELNYLKFIINDYAKDE